MGKLTSISMLKNPLSWYFHADNLPLDFFLVHSTRRSLLDKVRLSGIIDVVFENKLRNERAEKLKNWFPQCECQICSGPAPQLEKSDQTRENLALLHNEVFLYIFLILKDCKILRQGESAEQEGQIEGGLGSRTQEGPTHRRTGGRAYPAGDFHALTNMN